MALSNLALHLAKYARDNSPAILTAVAVSGVVSTSIFAAKGHKEAYLQHVKHDAFNWPRKEQARLVWRCYLPASITGTVTIACIIGATAIGHRRQAALAGAVAFGEKAFTEYRDQVVEVLGEKKEGEVRTAVAQKRVDANPPTETQLVMAGDGEQLCFETYSGRYFRSDMETIRKAVNDLNEQILHDGYASANEFWSSIGLETNQVGEEVGWISERLLDVKYNAVLHSNKAVMTIDYTVVPIRGYNVFG